MAVPAYDSRDNEFASLFDLPDYLERSVLEALVNALIHRDYLELGSEVHIDIFDNTLKN